MNDTHKLRLELNELAKNTPHCYDCMDLINKQDELIECLECIELSEVNDAIVIKLANDWSDDYANAIWASIEYQGRCDMAPYIKNIIKNYIYECKAIVKNIR